MPEPPSVGVDSSTGQNRMTYTRCRSLQVWGGDSSFQRLAPARVRVPEPPSVGVDSSTTTQHVAGKRCRSLQVWGWTVHRHGAWDTPSGAGASKCGGGQFQRMNMPIRTPGAGASKCGGGQFTRTSMGTRTSGAGASKCGGGQFEVLIDGYQLQRCRSLQVWVGIIAGPRDGAACRDRGMGGACGTGGRASSGISCSSSASSASAHRPLHRGSLVR